MFLLIIPIVLSLNIITWISFINGEYIISSFNPDNPTLDRLCFDNNLRIIEDNNGFFFKYEENNLKNFLLPLKKDDYLIKNYKRNKNQNCFKNGTFYTKYNNNFITKECL